MFSSAILEAYEQANGKDFTRLIRSLPSYVTQKAGYEADKTICYHEAGHVVILHCHNERMRYVTIEDPPHVKAPRPKDKDVRIMLHMAGIVGGALYSGEYDFSATVDLDMIDRELKKERRYDLVPLWRRTHDVLITQWHWVCNVAERLHREKKIYY